MTGRPGCANFAAIAYGTPGTIVASVPESEARFPLRSFNWRANQFVEEPESAVTIASSGSTCESSWTTRCGFIGSASIMARRSTMSHQSSTFASIFSRQRRSSLRTRCGSSARSVSFASPISMHVRGVADADHVGLDVDLDAACLAFLRQELRVREARADHEQRVAALHHVVARDRAEEADRAGHERKVVGEDVLAEQCLGDSGTEEVGDTLELLGGTAGALADEHRDLLPLVEDLGCVLDVVLLRQDARPAVADARVDGAVGARRRLDGFHLGDVVRDDDRADTAVVEGDPAGAIDEVPRLRRVHAVLDVLGHVREQDRQVDLLLVVRAERGALLLADDRDDGHVVELRVVEAVEEVDRARTGGRHADPERVGAGKLRVTARHEGGHLLVAGLDEVGVAVGPVERAEEGIDPVAGVAVDPVDAPLAQALQDVVGDELGHWSLLLGNRSQEVVDVRPERKTLGHAGLTRRRGLAGARPGTGPQRPLALLDGRSEPLTGELFAELRETRCVPPEVLYLRCPERELRAGELRAAAGQASIARAGPRARPRGLAAQALNRTGPSGVGIREVVAQTRSRMTTGGPVGRQWASIQSAWPTNATR